MHSKTSLLLGLVLALLPTYDTLLGETTPNASTPASNPTPAFADSIKSKCGFDPAEPNDKKLRKALRCVNRSVQLRRQALQASERLQATDQALSPKDTADEHTIAARAILKSPTSTSGQSDNPNPNGAQQNFVGGSLIGTPTTCGALGSGFNNPALIRVHRSVMTPQVAMDDFGYRLGHRYIVYQVTIENGSKDFQFMLHDVSIDFSPQYHAPAGTYSHSASSQDLTLLRGVPEKGQDMDPRNRVLHVLQGIGSVAGAVSGLTAFSDVMASSTSAFSGTFMQSYITIAPDHTGTQLNRLSDSAFIANTVIDKLRAKTIAIFVPADEVLSHDDQSAFRKDPNAFLGFDSGNLNAADICVDGTFVQAVVVAAPTLSTAVLDAPDPGPNHDGVLTVAGSNLVAGDTVVVIGTGTTSRAAVVTTDGKTGKAQVHLPTDYSAGKTTAMLQSTLSPSLNSGAGVIITVATPVPAVAPTLTAALLANPGPGADKDGTLIVFGRDLVANDTVVVLGAGSNVQRTTIVTTDGSTSTLAVHLPKDYVAGTTTAVLQSTQRASLMSAGIPLLVAPAIPTAAPTLTSAVLDKPDPGPDKDAMLTITGTNLLVNETVVALGTGTNVQRALVTQGTATSSKVSVHLPKDYVAGTTTVMLQSAQKPAMASAAVKITP